MLFAYYWIEDDHASETVIRCYGIAQDGKSTTCLHIMGFRPYLYIELPLAYSERTEFIDIVVAKIRPFIIDFRKCDRTHLYNSRNTLEQLPFLWIKCHHRLNIQQVVSTLKTGIYFEGQKIVCPVHETEASSILQLTSIQNIPMAGWITYKGTEPKHRQTYCEHEVLVYWRDLLPSQDPLPIPQPTYLAFDIEVNSTFTNQMPQDRPGDKIFQISCVVRTNQGSVVKHLLTIDGISEPLDNIIVTAVTSDDVLDEEAKLLLAFFELVRKYRPQVMLGFNIFGFDIDYIMKRASRLALQDALNQLGFHRTLPARCREIKWSSSAYQNQCFKFLDWEGILLLDLLPIAKRDFKLDTYTLKNVAASFLKEETKDPVTYKDIFTAFQTRTGLATVGKYCVQDSYLCLQLVLEWHTWIAFAEMAKVCHVSMFTLYTQGQQIKLYAQVYRYCFKHKIVVTSHESASLNERYRGAHVIEPKPGFYNRVVPLDFCSLYPSIIIAYNICYSTLVNESVPDELVHIFRWHDHMGCVHDPKEINIQTCTDRIHQLDETIKHLRSQRSLAVSKEAKQAIQDDIHRLSQDQKPWREQRAELKKNAGQEELGPICAQRHYRFLKSTIKKGVVPSIIQNLLESRQRVKTLIKSCQDDQQKIAYEKEQLAYKVSANSMYGAMGVKKGYLPFMPGAMCVTYVGRQALESTARLIQEKFQGQLIYGDTDSNYVIFPQFSSIPQLWNYANHVAQQVTDWTEADGTRLFPRPIQLDFEQTIYNKFLILSKKRYLYQEVNQQGQVSNKVGKKGVVLARRDNAQIVRSIYEQVVDALFSRQETTQADLVHMMHQFIQAIYLNQRPLEDYIITKSVGSVEGSDQVDRLGNYKIRPLPQDPNQEMAILSKFGQGSVDSLRQAYYLSCLPAHVQLAERMRQRGIPVDVGSRLEFVVTQRYNQYTLAEKLEDFNYFKEHADILELDYGYYVKALIQPLDQIFTVLGYGEIVKELSHLYEKYDEVRRDKRKAIFMYRKKKSLV